MKVIMLDFDGVLNSARWMRLVGNMDHACALGMDAGRCLDPAAVGLVNQIIDRTGAVVVVSSAWRINSTPTALQELLAKRGFMGRVIGCTQDGPKSPRGNQIYAWLQEHADVDGLVILDDRDDMVDLSRWLVLTNIEEGLTQDHVECAVAALRGPFVLPTRG